MMAHVMKKRIVGLVLMGYSEGMNFKANIVKRAPLIEVENLTRKSGIVKIHGNPVSKCDISIPDCENDLIYSKTIREHFVNNEWSEVKVDSSITNFNLEVNQSLKRIKYLYLRFNPKSYSIFKTNFNDFKRLYKISFLLFVLYY